MAPRASWALAVSQGGPHGPRQLLKEQQWRVRPVSLEPRQQPGRAGLLLETMQMSVKAAQEALAPAPFPHGVLCKR